MTATIEETDTRTIDPTDSMFELVHHYCGNEYPKPGEQWNGKRCIAICGQESTFNMDFPRDSDGWPLNPCPQCLSLARRVDAGLIGCPRCGSNGA